jgi:hypothetical protein
MRTPARQSQGRGYRRHRLAFVLGKPFELGYPLPGCTAHDATDMPTAATAANRCILMGIVLCTLLMLLGLCGRKEASLCVLLPLERLDAGVAVMDVARLLGVDRATLYRLRAEAAW